ncbi:MAG: alpha/beta fold hydrolase [Deltaproteobacteria bacterium]|nr:alpha/beta fold hydrolase [Deltaproteobacteria bacterium]
MITQTIRPVFLKGGPHGILLLHGFTSTPQCMEAFAARFHKAKFTVSAPIIDGHATHHLHLEKTRWEDWYQSSEAELKRLARYCERVFVAGLSMGGLLSLHLAQNHPQTVRAIALMATPLYLDGFLVRHVFPFVWKTPLRWLYRYQTKYNAGINEPLAKRRYQTYPKIPVRSVAELLELQMVVRGELRYIHQPAFIAHSKLDKTVPFGNLDYIRAALGSPEVETLTLSKSNHILTVDYEHEKLFHHLLKFFNHQKKRKTF